MIRGTVVWVNLEDRHPPEFGKTRPAVIVSNTEQNRVLSTIVVVPLSTRPPEIWPLRMECPLVSLKKTSYAVIPGIRQIRRDRVLGEVEALPLAFMKELGKAVEAYLGDC